MHEIVIVISDLYLAQAPSGRASGLVQGQLETPPGAPGSGAFPGIEHVARFGERTALEGGWRPWLARWLGRGDLANVAPGVIAAVGVVSAGAGAVPAAVGAEHPAADAVSIAADGVSAGPAASAASAGAESPPDSTAWIATPVHLIAGLTSLHLDRRSILRLPTADLEGFALDFNRAFGDSGLRLTPLAAGDFLMQGPATLTAATTEPARALVADLEASLPKGNDAKALKRLGAELEMWLHAHPLNETRRRRGELPVSTLWLWGGTPAQPGRAQVLAAGDSPSAANTTVPFGNDPYLIGLCRLHGDTTHLLPDQLTDLLTDPRPQRAVLVIEVTTMLYLNPHWTVLEALAEIDRRFVSPAIVGLGEGSVESVVLLANDTHWRVRRRDRLKLWRRAHPGITALQRPG